MKLQPHEILLQCTWVFDGKKVTGDSTCERIRELTTKGYLKELGVTDDGWSTLFKDPSDDRLWELDYPEGYRHGGGPPRLRHITRQEALDRYGPSFDAPG